MVVVEVAGSALGPMPMGIARDLFGSYTLPLTVLVALRPVLGRVVSWVASPYESPGIQIRSCGGTVIRC